MQLPSAPRNLSILALCLVGSGVLTSCNSHEKEQNTEISSPSGKIKVGFELNSSGVPTYSVTFDSDTLIAKSTMRFEFANTNPFNGDFEIIGVKNREFEETWQLPWGEQLDVENKYRELSVELRELGALKRLMNIYFRVYDDGLGFRYEFPKQAGWDKAEITNELTEFNLTGDHQCWWIPGDWDIYEHLYNTTKLSQINALNYVGNVNLAQTYIPENAVNTPITMRTTKGVHLSFHEANLTDYSGMTLKIDTAVLGLVSNLVGSENHNYKVSRELPFQTPWRTIQISETAGGLIESNLILNLNEPNKLGDVSWIKPMKYIGIWWAMHLGKNTWEKSSGRHGATTENTKAHMDFAAANGFGGVLVEGWNTGWEHWIGFEDREGVFDFVTAYDDYNLAEVVAYGKSKGVTLIMHHETSSATETYDQQLDTAFALMASLDIHTVKTGYVGKILPKGEYHHGQYMVNHYRRVLEMSAKYKVAINAHEPIKDTGIRRTYPNAISREGLRGQEFNAWGAEGGNPPEHLPIVAFTRMLAGPIDFTPGVFDIKLKPYKPNNQVNTTLAHQLALYVVVYSPIQMACDLLENYENQPAFQFIKDVGVDWSQTQVLAGEVGDFAVIAREERQTNTWFIGGITDENERVLDLNLDFLPANSVYELELYRDGDQAHWNDNPLDIIIERVAVPADRKMSIKLAPGGGFAGRLIKTGN